MSLGHSDLIEVNVVRGGSGAQATGSLELPWPCLLSTAQRAGRGRIGQFLGASMAANDSSITAWHRHQPWFRKSTLGLPEAAPEL